MVKKKIVKPSKKRLIFNKKQDSFISFEDDMALQELEREKQNKAKAKALTSELLLGNENDEPSHD